MIVVFELNMPRVGSWNGQWSGQGQRYARVKSARSKELVEKLKKIVETGSYRYAWDDGWCARVDVRQIDSKEAAKIRRMSKGFCGYDWMIDSILKHDEMKIGD